MSKQRKHPKRAISGIFLLDKAKGASSNRVMQQVKHAFQAEKAGHTGALDPMATGLLPVCLGEATKFSHYLLDANKGYNATIKLGSQTDTGDTEGEVVVTADVPVLNEASIATVLSHFMGAQKQVPPMYSALKKDGKKLYELARAGETVERPARDIHIYELSVLSYDAENTELHISVTCSKGTYIRVLGEDIAKALGTAGHLSALRRTKTGSFQLDDAMTFDSLSEIEDMTEKDGLLLPSYASITDFPRIELTEEQVERIKFGQRLNLHEQAKALFGQNQFEQKLDEQNKLDVLMFSGSAFYGLGKLEASGRMQPKRLVKPDAKPD